MFILIPLIIIFLSFSYINVNENIGIYTEVSLYLLMIFVSIISIILYKNIQNNLIQQENNKIRLEIVELKEKLKKSTDEVLINSIKHKIKLRESEII